MHRVESRDPCGKVSGPGWVYSNLLGTERQGMYRAGGGLRLDG